MIDSTKEIARRTGVSANEAKRLAAQIHLLPAHMATGATSVFGVWTPASHREVAAHFKTLSYAYGTLNDTGRAVATARVAKRLYQMLEDLDNVTYEKLLREDHFGKSMLAEIVDYFVASGAGEMTARAKALSGAYPFFKAARWFF